MSTEAVAESPIQIALSGPSGGVTGSAYLAREIGVPDILTFDMGGTSTDVSLCLNGETPVRRDIQLGYFQFKSPAVDVHSVGAGGGSIAFVSASGALQAQGTTYAGRLERRCSTTAVSLFRHGSSVFHVARCSGRWKSPLAIAGSSASATQPNVCCRLKSS